MTQSNVSKKCKVFGIISNKKNYPQKQITTLKNVTQHVLHSGLLGCYSVKLS